MDKLDYMILQLENMLLRRKIEMMEVEIGIDIEPNIIGSMLHSKSGSTGMVKTESEHTHTGVCTECMGTGVIPVEEKIKVRYII